MHDTTFPFDRQTYAKLSREELESFGKQAAVAYLSTGCSLNEAIIKIARQHPSISSHQIKRIVEFANQETFSRLFSDNEKYASDKNIEFPVADPGEILQTLNMQACPEVINAPDSEYHTGPVKTASVGFRTVEADLALAREFGFDPVSEKAVGTVLTKEAQEEHDSQFTNRILETKLATPADRILAAGEEGISGDTASGLTQDMVPDVARQESEEEQATKEAFMPGVTRSGPTVYGVKPPSQGTWVGSPTKGWRRATVSAPMQQKIRQHMPKVAMGGPEAVMMNAQPQQHPEVTHRENMRTMERRIEIEKKKQELVAMQQKGMQAMGDQGGAPEPGAQPPGMAPPPGGVPMGAAPPPGGMPPGVPPGAGGPPPQGAPTPEPPPQLQKASSLMDEALLYAKMGRPMSPQVVEDLSRAVSVEKLKEAAAERGQYPMANPHGELHRMQQKLARVRDEARVARDKNEFLMKEAEGRFLDSVTQHVLGGGNLGELIHACQSVPGNDNVISSAMTKAAQHLAKKGVDPAKIRGSMLTYEIEKSASIRSTNFNHPVVSAFNDFCKLAVNQPLLSHAVDTVTEKFQEVDAVLTQAIQHARSA